MAEEYSPTDSIQEDDSLWDVSEEIPELPKSAKERIALSPQPMFQTLFVEYAQDSDDPVLLDFARAVVGPLSEQFGTVSAKGGAFFRMKVAEGAQGTERYQRDQTLRGHLINGMLPARHIAKLLHRWGAQRLGSYWDEMTERLFVAGFMLHDFTKIPAIKQALKDAGFQEGEAPSERQIPVLERIFIEWCNHLGLEAFLRPVGGSELLAQDLIYIAVNTQQLWGTAHAEALYSRLHTDSRVRNLAAEVSHLADLLAYVAPTPRALVAHDTIRKAITAITGLGSQVGRLVYHHVAENRGLILNFIHNAALEALTIPDQRVPILYAPSGVVYLERHDAPPMPSPADLTDQIVAQIRRTAGDRLLETGKGAKRGNTGLRVADTQNDFFDLREFIVKSIKLVTKYIRNNKSVERIAAIRQGRWIDDSQIPRTSEAAKDARVDQIAEWTALMETQFRDSYKEFDPAGWLLQRLGIADLRPTFDALRAHPEARQGGIKYWWFWAAAHAVNRHDPVLTDDTTIEWLEALAGELAATLPEELPPSARANEEIWQNLADYVGQVLTLGGAKAATDSSQTELERYVRAKTSRGKAACAICGSSYVTRKQTETAVAFQPGVYTARVRIGASENKRSICSICGLEQLLRQLFVHNLDIGSKVESQRVRYLSFYPSYFFTPETMTLVRRVYQRLTSVRLSDTSLCRAMEQADLGSSAFWQRLDPFLLPPLETESRRVVRYSEAAQSTFLMVGFRNFNDPSDSESWILPAFLSLVLPISLDVKVIASESSVPLLTEASEFPETVWLEGAHAAIREIVGDGRLNVDQVLPALQRLAAAYLIHLDTEYEPPKENWHRFPPIAHALAESPLYVFHYLKKQERDGDRITSDRERRYVAYADLFDLQGDMLMSHAKELVRLYRQFYRAKSIGNANSVLRPLSVVADALLVADQRLFSDTEALVEVAYGELYRFMDRVGKGLADGRFPKGVSVSERDEAMRQFCQTFVNEVFMGIFRGDVSALRGKQLNLLRSACEVLYRDAQRLEWAERGQDEAAAAEGAQDIEEQDAEENNATSEN